MLSCRSLLAGLLAAVAVATAASAQPVETQPLRMFMVSFNPFLYGQSGDPRLHEHMGYHNPATEVYDYMDGMYQASHGIIDERLTVYLEMNFWPVKADGFQYTEAQWLSGNWHQPDLVDYAIITRDYDLARKVDTGEVDEVAIYGAPYFGYYESRMAGRGGYWCNSPALQRVACSRIFIFMGWNYERIVSLHATGHRVESIMTYVYNGWDVNGNRTIWDRFGWNIGQTTISSVYGIGSAHLPANGDDHYDYANTQSVTCYAPQWENFDPNLPQFPDPTGATAIVDRETWGSTPNSYEMGYFIWWYQHMPHIAGTNNYDGYTRLNNWWEYLFNFNEHAESGGDHVKGGSPPPATPYGRPITQLTDNAYDDFAPLVNNSGRVVWKQRYRELYQRWYAGSVDATGGPAAGLSFGSLHIDQPRINNNNQVVYQRFDGEDYEIYTANADGTNILQITNNDVNDWHPDISDTGRIVWDRWDGTDYEIFSANFDGTDVVQITNRSYSGSGTRPDDTWPRINDSDRVVWMGHDGGNFEIYSANADGSGLVQITNTSYQNEFPQITNGGQVVWHAWHSDSNSEVWAANATGGGVTRLSNNSVLDWWPQANTGGDVVWMQRSSAGNWEIMSGTVNGGAVSLTTNSQHDQYPVIDDAGRIAWQGFDGSDWEIYTYDSGTIYQVTDNDYDDFAPAMAALGESIVWHGESEPGDPNAAGYDGPTFELFSVTNEDLDPPTLVAATAVGVPTQVTVEFSEPVDQVTADDAGNYAIDQGVTVTGAALQPDGVSVLLTTSTLSEGTLYTLTVSNVEDLAGNPIAPGSQVQFELQEPQRITDGLVALYLFDTGSGNVVYDVSGFGTPLDLGILNTSNVTWTSTGLRIDAPTRLRSNSAFKVFDACTTSNEVTIETWIVPDPASQGGPARIVTMSAGLNDRNFTLGHGDPGGSATTAYDVRLRTTDTGLNGASPSTTTGTGVAANTLQHVVYTRNNAGSAVIYVDTAPEAAETITGSFSNWTDFYRLCLANETTDDQPWLGEYRLVAIYDQALSAAEVSQNFLAGLPSAFEVGDMNCDGAVDVFDINPFVDAVLDPAAYMANYPDCDINNGDINGDGAVDVFDINPFVDLILG